MPHLSSGCDVSYRLGKRWGWKWRASGWSHMWSGASPPLSGYESGDDLSRVVSVPKLLEQKPWGWGRTGSVLLECKHSFSLQHQLFCSINSVAQERSSAGPRGPDVGTWQGPGSEFWLFNHWQTSGLFVNHQPCKHQQCLPHPWSGFHFESPHHLKAEICPQLWQPSPQCKAVMWGKQDWSLPSQAGACTSAKSP